MRVLCAKRTNVLAYFSPKIKDSRVLTVIRERAVQGLYNVANGVAGAQGARAAGLALAFITSKYTWLEMLREGATARGAPLACMPPTLQIKH